MEHYDAVIVGARCAGATLGTLLARAGWSVLMLDKDPLGAATRSRHTSSFRTRSGGWRSSGCSTDSLNATDCDRSDIACGCWDGSSPVLSRPSVATSFVWAFAVRLSTARWLRRRWMQAQRHASTRGLRTCSAAPPKATRARGGVGKRRADKRELGVRGRRARLSPEMIRACPITVVGATSVPRATTSGRSR
jgi:glycine/D-amino acid oxidase-like deaminating enzyme